MILDTSGMIRDAMAQIASYGPGAGMISVMEPQGPSVSYSNPQLVVSSILAVPELAAMVDPNVQVFNMQMGSQLVSMELPAGTPAQDAVLNVPLVMADGSAANILTPALEIPKEAELTPPDRRNVIVAIPENSEIDLARLPGALNLGRFGKVIGWGVVGITVVSLGVYILKGRKG